MNLDIIPLRNNLLRDSRYNEIKNNIYQRLIALNLNNIIYKFDNEFLCLLVNLIEFTVYKNDKINKKELCLKIMEEVFCIILTDDEKKAISTNIDFLHGNNFIKKVSSYKLFRTSIKEWFKKK